MRIVTPWMRINKNEITLRFTTCIHYIRKEVLLVKFFGFGIYKDLK
jgi:hypothetical protein